MQENNLGRIQLMAIQNEGPIIECDECRFLLHYEWGRTERKHNLPRCSIEFRDGSQVKHPCSDFKEEKHGNKMDGQRCDKVSG